jgi:cell shape-determining protein MreC
MLLPERWTAPVKSATAAVMAPGQKLAAHCRRAIARRLELWQWQLTAAEEQRAAAEELAALRRRNRELETAVSLALSREASEAASALESAPPMAEHDRAPLVQTDLVGARVLGPQARSFLSRLELLDAGDRQGVQPGAIVLAGGPAAADASVILDQGHNAGLNVDDLALAGRSVVGKIVDVGSQTAVMRRITEPGYRDLVQLAQPHGERLRFGAKGVLEGTGEGLCRVSMIELTEPVSPGDWVLSTGNETGPLPAVYGRVTRAERQPGDAHWRVWMTPAARGDLPGEVDIVRLRLNPQRVASAKQGAAQ